ncbi:hypothetical protein FOCC_FOCC008888 [Frankliniella occidentalis]|nr:hypothetical protein FOCC_FOCC008888 [Frankliniella occidentalis]
MIGNLTQVVALKGKNRKSRRHGLRVCEALLVCSLRAGGLSYEDEKRIAAGTTRGSKKMAFQHCCTTRWKPFNFNDKTII